MQRGTREELGPTPEEGGSGSGGVENISGSDEASLASQGGSGQAVPAIDIWGTVGSIPGRPWGQ